MPPVQPVIPEVAPVAAGEPAAPVGDEKIVHIKPPIIVRELAQQIGLKPFQLIHDLMDMNIFAAINHTIEPDVAAAICKKHGYTFEVEKREKGRGRSHACRWSSKSRRHRSISRRKNSNLVLRSSPSWGTWITERLP